MSRRAAPEKLHLARRAGLLGRLTSTLAIAPEQAERLVAAFEIDAAAIGRDNHAAGYWVGAFERCADRVRDEVDRPRGTG